MYTKRSQFGFNFDMLVYLKNQIRAYGRIIRQRWLTPSADRPETATFGFVVATRLPNSKFWKHSLTGQSLERYKDNPQVILNIHYSNKRGLGEVYAEEVINSKADYLIFLHDDVCLLDDDLLDKLHRELSIADIIGVAGSQYRHSRQPAWLFSKVQTSGGFAWDHPNLSGKVAHGSPTKHEFTEYGPVGVNCKLLDGVFLGVHTGRVRRANVNFSPDFVFHFYDMDFCRSAEHHGLLMRTADISVLHESSGTFGTASWWDAYRKYLTKWED